MDIFWILLIITAIVYLLLRYYPRKRKKNQVEEVGMDSLGFHPIPFPEAILKKKVVQLHTKYEGQQLALHDVFQKNFDGVNSAEKGDQWIYLFDIEDQAGKESTILAQDVIAIIDTRLSLPRITILTRPNATGEFGGIIDRFVSRFANWENNTQSLRKIDFLDQPEINKRYFVFSTSPDQGKTFLTIPKLEFLLNLSEHYAIDMVDDLITVHLVITGSKSSRRFRITQTLADATNLARILSENNAAG